jgi:malate permease and related proteins
MIELDQLWKLYLPLIGWVSLGLLLGCRLPGSIPQLLGKFLFWIGVPLSILAFLRQAHLSAATWMAPLAAWAAILLGMALAWGWLRGWLWLQNQLDQNNPQSALWTISRPLPPPTQGSFLLTAMVGNTGYLGYPVILALVGSQYFGWAVLYDTLGSALGAYGLGVLLAAQFGQTADPASRLSQSLRALVYNPALWSFWLGLEFRRVPLPQGLERDLEVAGWIVVALSLLLIGMRLSQLRGWQNLPQAAVSLSIKMVIVPLLVGLALPYFGIQELPRLVIVLQAAMPPAFATLVIAEAYNLDQSLTVTSLALGSLLLLLLLPVWLWLFLPG